MAGLKKLNASPLSNTTLLPRLLYDTLFAVFAVNRTQKQEVFVKDFGAALDKKLRDLDKRMVTFDIMLEVLELNKKFNFVTSMPEYHTAILELVQEREEAQMQKKMTLAEKEKKRLSEGEKSVPTRRSKTPGKKN